MYLEITLLAYLIDRVFGEFDFIKHPVVIMGDYINWFEKKFYRDSTLNGAILTLTLIIIVWLIVGSIKSNINNHILLGIIASTTIASKMLHDSVKDIIKNPHHIKYLVSRDTKELNQSDINRASIETYAENLSDGVIAPLFYLILFGLEGAFIYKAINTLDSMVGYRNERYEKFGKFSAILDDVANYIPARITALLISILFLSKKALLEFYSYGKKHDSPNAAHPISAMALAIGVKLGGDTAYFGKIKKKASFGNGREAILVNDIKKSLSLQKRLDIFIILSLLGAIAICEIYT
ncbi:Adenosylcobinamide-phosphate synthase [hydrothermal vent metagenome]|uniref:Adenosylcobinamide-phosphate synthase n=1 Tax=hydrothermal vent metagenome TaxID=652676 RepID=A0A1W1BY10_9ZZZZ